MDETSSVRVVLGLGRKAEEEESVPMGVTVRRSRSEEPSHSKGRKRSKKSEGHSPSLSKKEKKRRKTRQKRKKEAKRKKASGAQEAPVPPPASPLLALPSEMLLLVLSFLSYREVAHLRTVCKTLNHISADVALLNRLGKKAGCLGRSYVPLECKFEVMEISSSLHAREKSICHQTPSYRKVDMDYSAVTGSRSSPSGKGSFLKWRSVSSLLQMSSAGFSRLSPRSPGRSGSSSPDLSRTPQRKASQLKSPERSEGKQRGRKRSKRETRRSKSDDGDLRMEVPVALPALPKPLRKERVTIFACGPPAVGVTSLVSRYLWRKFSHKSEPTIYERHQFEVTIDGILIEVDLLETQGHPKYADLRKSAMAEAEGFLLAYSSTSSRSLLSLKSDIIPTLRWTRERRGRDIPVVLTACQEDCLALREVPYEMGEELAEELAAPFLETSAKYAVNISTAFETIIRMVLRSQKRRARDEDRSSVPRRSASGPSAHGRK